MKETFFSQYLKGFTNLLFPNLCIGCETQLISTEQCICLSCRYNLPFFKAQESLKELFGLHLSKINTMHAFLIFQKENLTQKLLHAIKYQNRKDLGLYLGTMWGAQLLPLHQAQHFDAIIPIPLFKSKTQKRGYNQSDLLAKGISKITGVSCIQGLQRIINNDSQTKKDNVERILNVKDVFQVHPQLKQKSLNHILIIDDVITTGATLVAAMHIIQEALPGCAISLGALAVAQ